ncbi:PI-PLC X domain-containing protein 1 isoform X2 [Oryzias melastigma]|uniref:PI-PLC X domain-containing protein 1 isoform X2 n=1 Tax=Oryzias melastigma TaxID=30732 RepID=UPI00168D1F64|nr:PI-PLC X domain-containing protein 1 isoform X2 [Oryzias melastigma]
MMENSDWMSKLPPHLHTVPLFNLAIPGSHDSMSFDLDVNSSIVEPDQLRRFSRFCCVRKLMFRWGTTQVSDPEPAETETTRETAGAPPAGGEHQGAAGRRSPLPGPKDRPQAQRPGSQQALLLPRAVHTERRGGFDKLAATLHNYLIHFIKTLFGPKLLLKTDKPILKTCWDQGRNVIVSYDHPAYQQSALWNKIQYYYGDSMERRVIVSRLSQVLEKEKPSNCFFVCGLNMTLPSDRRILKYILRICDSFPSVVRRSLPKLLQWVQQQNRNTPFNIVASDVVTRSGFVPTVVRLNGKPLKG